MIQETIPLINGRVEVSEYGDIIYFDVYGDYTDEDVMHMTQYLEHYFQKIGKPTTRIWDSTHIENFMLTSKGTDMFRQWSDKIKMMWPGNIAYMIAKKVHVYGVSRMYELKTSDENMSVNVVHSIVELPLDIRNRLQAS